MGPVAAVALSLPLVRARAESLLEEGMSLVDAARLGPTVLCALVSQQ